MHWVTFERFLPHNLKPRGKQKKWVLWDYINVYKLDLEGGGVILEGIFSLFSLSAQHPKMKEKKLGWCTINFHCKLTKVQRDSHIPHSGFTILEFWVCEFQLSSVIRVSSFHISVQIKVEMHSSKNMPAGEDIAILQFSLSWCMIR